MIHKHELIVGYQSHPTGRVLSVGNQDNRLICWTDSTKPGGTAVEVRMTDTPVPTLPYRFVGTVLLDDGRFAVHVFVTGESL